MSEFQASADKHKSWLCRLVRIYGNASANRAEADLSHLPSTLEIAPATLGPSQVSGGATRLIAKPALFPRMRVALWSVLLLAVVLLSWMAYRISKEENDTR